jgi:hypothetical protein
MSIRKIVTILCLALTLSLAACGNKVPVDVQTFIEKSRSANLEITDATDQFTAGDISSATIASGDGYQVEFYVLPSESLAIDAFDTNQADFQKLKESSSITASVSIGNTSRYELTSSGKFYLVSRIGNTFFYSAAESQYKDAIKKFVSDMGY